MCRPDWLSVLVQINVVSETRLYNAWGGGGSGQVDADSGIIRGKQVLSKLHYEMGRMGFTQVSDKCV